tara:strand:- start:677 stop:1003 length:327 start_codon:yes stop_codon:yes gene_type:complete
MLEELERWEEAEIKEMNENHSEKSINISAVYDTPDPKVLSDYFNLGRIVTYWHIKSLREDINYDLNKVDFDALVVLFKKEINDLKLFEKIKEDYSEAMRRDEEDQKYV